MTGFDQLSAMLKRMWSKAPGREKSGLPGLYHTNPRLDPVRVIAKNAASVEWKLYSKKDIRKNGDAAEAIDEHELYDLLNNPCPTFTELDGWSLRYLTFAHIRLVGEFFWLKVRDGNKIIALLPVPSAWVAQKPTVGNHFFLVYPYGVTASNALRVLPEDIVWFKDPDLSDPYGSGRGSTEAIADEAETDEYAAKYQKNFFFNDASPPYVILAPNANPETAKQIKTTFMQRLSGWMHSREPAVLTGKETTIQKLGQSMVEVDMIATRKYLRDETLQHYQIPPEIYGIIENSNRATIDSAYYLLNKNVISYDLKFFERTVTAQLLRVDYDVDLCLKHDQIIAEDETAALAVYQVGLEHGLVTEDEFRARFRMQPVKDGNVRVMPFSLMRVPVGQVAPVRDVAPVPDKPAKDPKEPVLDIEDDPDVLEIDDGKSYKSLEEKEIRLTAIWKAFDNKATSTEDLFIKAVKKFSAVQRDKVKDVIKKATTEDALTKAINGQFTNATHNAVKSSLAPAWTESLKAGRDHALDVMGGKAYHAKSNTSDVTNVWFNKWIETAGLKKAKQIDDTTQEELIRTLVPTLVNSIESGDGMSAKIDALMKAADDVYFKLDESRARMIARTETTSAVNAGSFALYSTEGVTKKTWLSVRDDRTRSIDDGAEFDHDGADDQTVGIDEKFIIHGTNGDEELDFPGDSDGSAGNVCNCRCSFIPEGIGE